MGDVGRRMHRKIAYVVGLILCAFVAVFVIWTLTGGYDVTLATLQAQRAEAEARAEVARTEGFVAKAALVEAEANAFVTRELGRVAARAVERQGTMLVMQQVVFVLLAVSAMVVNGLLWWSVK